MICEHIIKQNVRYLPLASDYHSSKVLVINYTVDTVQIDSVTISDNLECKYQTTVSLMACKDFVIPLVTPLWPIF